MYIPTLANKIIDYNANPSDANVGKINLAGLAIGNGCTDRSECTVEGHAYPVHNFEFLAGNNFISQELYQELVDNTEECQYSTEPNCQALYSKAKEQANANGYASMLLPP